MISSMSFLKDPENAESSMIDRIVSENKKTEKEKEEKAEQSVMEIIRLMAYV